MGVDGQCCCFPIQSQINLSKLIDRFIRVFFNLFLSYFFFSFLIRFQKEVEKFHLYVARNLIL